MGLFVPLAQAGRTVEGGGFRAWDPRLDDGCCEPSSWLEVRHSAGESPQHTVLLGSRGSSGF